MQRICPNCQSPAPEGTACSACGFPFDSPAPKATGMSTPLKTFIIIAAIALMMLIGVGIARLGY